MKSRARGDGALIAVSLRAFPGERRVSFPPLAKGGRGGVAPAQAITEFSEGLLTRLAASLCPVAKDGKAIHDVRDIHPHPPWPPLRKGGKELARPRRLSIARNKNTRLPTAAPVPPTRT